MMQQQGQVWQGFQPGDKPDATLTAGSWLAYLLPGIVEIPTRYGGALKLRYHLFVPSRRGTRRFETSELASPIYTTGSKFVKRLGAVNPGITITDQTDLSMLKTEGYCLVELVEKPGTSYLEIDKVTQLPRGFTIPADIGDPTAPPLDMQTQKVSAVDSIRRDEIDDIEPPF